MCTGTGAAGRTACTRGGWWSGCLPKKTRSNACHQKRTCHPLEEEAPRRSGQVGSMGALLLYTTAPALNHDLWMGTHVCCTAARAHEHGRASEGATPPCRAEAYGGGGDDWCFDVLKPDELQLAFGCAFRSIGDIDSDSQVANHGRSPEQTAASCSSHPKTVVAQGSTCHAINHPPGGQSPLGTLPPFVQLAPHRRLQGRSCYPHLSAASADPRRPPSSLHRQNTCEDMKCAERALLCDLGATGLLPVSAASQSGRAGLPGRTAWPRALPV